MPPLLHRFILSTIGLSLCAMPAWAEDEATAWRLFIADHGKPLVTAIELGTDAVKGSFESLPRPRLAVAGGHIAVTDPLAGIVHLVDAESFTPARDIPVSDAPYNIVAVGGSGHTHD